MEPLRDKSVTSHQISALRYTFYGRTLPKNQISTICEWRSPFFIKKLIVSTPRILRNLHTMSQAKAAPDGLKDCECEKMALHECPLIPYVPEKDSVKETVSAYKDNHLKTLINKGTELWVPIIWYSGTCEVFLIHVGSTQEVIEKKSNWSLTRNIPELLPKSAIRSSS